MTRTQALVNAQVVEIYLEYYMAEAYVTKDVEPHQIRIHVFSPRSTENEIRHFAEEIGNLRDAESDFEFVRNDKADMLTFNVIWNIDN